MDLLQPLPPLSRREWSIFWVLALVCAATRFAAMASSIWGWDEALFCLGMRAYDVTLHHPHPPGFPMFMALGKLARFVAPSDFRALQSINLLAGMALFPSLFLLARELRFRFNVAVLAATLCAFFPNVWFFGGTALSDVPSIVLATLAAALLFRGCRSANAYLLGTLVLAIAIGIRPQNFLIGLAPGLIATWYRAKVSWRDIVFAALLGSAIVIGAFGFAAQATGSLDRYLAAVREHGEYISRVDSFRSPDRPPLWRLVDRFFLLQYQSRVLSIVTSIFVLIAIGDAMRRRPPTGAPPAGRHGRQRWRWTFRRAMGASGDYTCVQAGPTNAAARGGPPEAPSWVGGSSIGYAALTFGPVAVMSWLMLDRFSVNRFSIGYAPLFAMLAAYGISRVAGKYEAYVGGALIAAFAIWTWPALTPVRNETSPPVRAIEAAVAQLDPARDELHVGFSLVPFVEYLAPQLKFVRVAEERGMPLTTNGRRAIVLAEARGGTEGGTIFRRERGHLYDITRNYYYDVALRTLVVRPRFISGWTAPERESQVEWRWMSDTSAVQLPRVDGPAKLGLAFNVEGSATVTITLNGKVLQRFERAPGFIEREWDVEGQPSNLLRIDVDPPRSRALKLTSLLWGPQRK